MVTIPARNAGDLVVVFFGSFNTTAAANPKVSLVGALNGVAWNVLGSAAGNSTNVDYVSAFYLWAGTTAASSAVTATGGSGWSFDTASHGVVISGAHASTPPEFASATGLDPPNLDPAGWGVEDTLWLAYTCHFSSVTSGDPAGFTNLGGSGGSRISYQNNATSAVDPGTFTGGTGSSAATVAIRPAAVPATSTARMLQFF